jgi:hypothetical protein
MTYTYIASTNTLKQVPTMEKPDSKDYLRVVHRPFGEVDCLADNKYYDDLKAYNAHLASLKEISCEPACKEVWKDGQEVVDEKDFEVQAICNGQRYDCRKVDRCGYCKLLAVAIKAESEDEDAMLDDIQLLLNCFDRKAGRNAVKQKYTISKKK